MALYTNPAHQAGVERAELSRHHQHHLHHQHHQHHQHDDPDKAILDMETVSDVSSQERVNVFVVFIFILELLVLIFVCVLEFFLRYCAVAWEINSIGEDLLCFNNL